MWSGPRRQGGSGCCGCLSGPRYRAARRYRKCRGGRIVAKCQCMPAGGSAQDRLGRERLFRYCARPLCADERLVLAGGEEQGTSAKDGWRSCRRHAGRTQGAQLWAQMLVCTRRVVALQCKQVQRAGVPAWVHHRIGYGAADTETCRRVNNCTGNRTGALTTAGDECAAAGCYGRGV